MASNRALWTAKILGKKLPSTSSLSFSKKPYIGIILGIDPSLRATGLALIVFRPNQKPHLIDSTTVRLSSKQSMAERLGEISKAVTAKLNLVSVTHVAVEQTIYVQNFQTAQVLGATRGAAIAAAAVRGIPVTEYPPLRVKQAVVGFGRASKEQMARTVKSMLAMAELLDHDEADAASVAICHALTSGGKIQ